MKSRVAKEKVLKANSSGTATHKVPEPVAEFLRAMPTAAESVDPGLTSFKP
jgi:hypothetical protein